MKISCTPISAKTALNSGELDQARYFELIAAGGADGTDIMDPNCYPWFWQNVEQDKKALSGRLKASGLTVAAYATGNHFAVREPENFKKQIEIVIRAIHEAAESGAPVLRIFGGYHKDLIPAHDMDYAEGLQLVVKGIEAVLPEARKCGVSLAIENHGRLPGLSAELLYIMKQFETPELGICLDIGNFYGAKRGLDELRFTRIAFGGATVEAETDRPARFEVITAAGVVKTIAHGTSVAWTMEKESGYCGPRKDFHAFARIKAYALDGSGEVLFSQPYMLT